MNDLVKFALVISVLSLFGWLILTIVSHFLMRELRKEERAHNDTMRHLRLLCRHASFAGAYSAYRDYYKKDENHLPADLLRRHYQAARIEWLARNPR